jgi:ADP-heptose:LPS heptosyltransferase
MKEIGILLSCNGMGDILSSIPTIRYFSKKLNSKIKVFTNRPELLKNFPYIDVYNFSEHVNFNNITIISTFQVGDRIHTVNDIRQIHALSMGIQLLPEEMNLEFYPDKFNNNIDLPDNYVVIHPSITWPSRTWNPIRWQQLVDKLNDSNINVVVVGKNDIEPGTYNTKKDVININIRKGVDLSNKIDIHQTWHVINKSNIIITMDSGLLHLAGSTNTHILQLGSSINPFFRSPYRKGSQKYKFSYILGECDKFCASNVKNNIKYNNNYKLLSPVPFCLEHPETIGDKNNFDINIYKCHPDVDKVNTEIIRLYNYYNFW